MYTVDLHCQTRSVTIYKIDTTSNNTLMYTYLTIYEDSLRSRIDVLQVHHKKKTCKESCDISIHTTKENYICINRTRYHVVGKQDILRPFIFFSNLLYFFRSKFENTMDPGKIVLSILN